MTGTPALVVGGRYELVRKLGEGGMAEVWLAADRRLDGRLVAIKRLFGFRPGTERASEHVERARREAYAVTRLTHPNLVTVTDFIAENDEPFIVMEYVEGTTLGELAGDAGLPPDRVAWLGSQVAAALAEAHAAGIVHRDVKPPNVMVTPRGDAKLADFGIARAVDDARQTATGAVTGTMRYLAPELVAGAPATPASDVWALGATLYEAVEGHPAFDAPTQYGLFHAISVGDVPQIRRAPALTPIVGRMLIRDPAQRPSAAEVADELRRLVVVPQAPPVPPPFLAGQARPRTPGTGSWVTQLAADRPGDAVGSPRPAQARGGPPRPPAKRRSPRWILVAAPLVVVAAGVAVAIGLGGSSDHPTASGQRPPVLGASSTGATPSASSPVTTSGQPRPGGANPGAGGAATTTPAGAVLFRGVTVTHATDLRTPPDVTSRSSADPTALEYDDLVVGTGASASPAATVFVRYVGARYADGVVFDSSWARGSAPVQFPLQGTIPGFARGIGGGDGVPAMHVGGRRLLIIPADEAYGAAGTSTIPPNAALVFVVDLAATS